MYIIMFYMLSCSVERVTSWNPQISCSMRIVTVTIALVAWLFILSAAVFFLVAGMAHTEVCIQSGLRKRVVKIICLILVKVQLLAFEVYSDLDLDYPKSKFHVGFFFLEKVIMPPALVEK